jgi:predicted permease
MSPLGRWFDRFSNLFRRRALDGELDEELQFHIDARTRDNIGAGMTAEAAGEDAARRFGNRTLARERAHDADILAWLESFIQDLRHGGRMFVKNPGFTAVAVISLALGTGANTAMFSAADAMLLRPLPVSHPDELVNIGSDFTTSDFRWSITSYPNYVDIRDRSTSFQGVLAFTTLTAGFAAHSGANPQVAAGMVVSGNFFDVLGVVPQLGRTFRADEDRVSGRDAVVVLSHGFWETLGSDPAIIGRNVKIGGIDFRVIGVAPESFSGPDRYRRPAFYVPLMMWQRLTGDSRLIQARDYWTLRVKGRLKPGISLAQAQAELNGIAKDLERAYPDTNRNQRLKARTQFETDVAENPVNAGLVAILTLLAAGVLIIACANVAGLLTSRAPVRAREIALRMSIGAGRPRLIRQLLTEALLIAGAGGILGLPMANAAIAMLRQVQYPSDTYFVPRVEIDERVLAVSLAVAMLSAVLFGLMPALETTRANLAIALKTSGEGSKSIGRTWGRHLLVMTQVAISLVLVTLAAFSYRMFEHELTERMGFRTSHILIMRFDPGLAGYNKAQVQRFYERLGQQARSTAGVEAATLTSVTPVWSPEASYIVPEGHRLAEGQSSAMVYSCNTDEYYFKTLDMSILRGRGFLATDTADAPRVAVVNQTLAEHYWHGQDPLGKRFWLGNDNGWVEIVGVARNSRYLHIGEQPADFVYFSYRQHPSSRMYLMAESAGESASLLAPLRAAVRRLDANMPIYDVHTMEEHYYARATSLADVTVEIVGGMGCMGVAIALAGLYALISYTVSRRRREIGIRMAVGAKGGDVVKMVLWQGVLPVIFGLAIGLALSAGAGRMLAASYPLAERVGPALYGAIAPILLAVATLAALVPARRAAQVDPMAVLRDE